jgi:hypothetical protein
MAPGFQLDWSLDPMCHLTPWMLANQITPQLLAQRLPSVKKAKLGETLKLLGKTMAWFGLLSLNNLEVTF